MFFTIILTLLGCALLFLMVLVATVFMPFRELAKNFPKDVQEQLQPRLNEIDKQAFASRLFGRILIVVMCLLFVGVYIIAGINGTQHGFSYWKLFLRFFVISFGVKAFDIIALDYFLLTKTDFFPHFFPETKDCAGWHNFGYNRIQHLKQSVIMLILCFILAFLFIKI